MLRYKGLHYAPCKQVCDSTVAEDYHISGRLATEAHEGKCLSLSGCVIKEHSGSLVDEEGSETSGHVSDTGYSRDG